MHRVELKDRSEGKEDTMARTVPNAPCGVESRYLDFTLSSQIVFLMHRVELKVSFMACTSSKSSTRVPNAPRGVERTK